MDLCPGGGFEGQSKALLVFHLCFVSPRSSIFLPVTRKLISAHHLEGHLNSLNAPLGERRLAQEAISEDAPVYPLRKSIRQP